MGYTAGAQMNLSAHFTLAEFTDSDTAVRNGIDNTPSAQILDALYGTAAGMERVRSILEVPVIISSGYRCPKLNAAVHGSSKSQHVKGEAVDFRAPQFGTPLQVAKELQMHLEFIGVDQLLWEGTWVHCSFNDNPRGEVLTAHFDNGRVTYTKGLRCHV